MNKLRQPSDEEKALLRALVQAKPHAPTLLATIDSLLVHEMKDGGMGSLLLIPKNVDNSERRFGRQHVMAECNDDDGVALSITLNLDNNGELYELDIWKVDFSPLRRWPKPATLRIVE